MWMVPVTSAPNIHDVPLLAGQLFAEMLAVTVTLLAGLSHVTPRIWTLNDTLKESGRGGSGSARSHRLRGALVVAEVALAVVALAGAGLFLKSFAMAKTISPGFDPRHVAIAEVDLSLSGYTSSQAAAFCRRLRQDLESKHGVQQ